MTLILFHIYLTVLLVTGITGFISLFFNKQAGLSEKLLPGFVLLTLGVEKFAWYWAARHGSNHDIFNVFMIIQYLFYSFLLYKMILSHFVRRAIAIASCIYLLISVLLIFVMQGIDHFNSIVFSVSAFGLTFFSTYYIYEVSKSPYKTCLFHSASLWIAVGILFYYSCLIPIMLAVPLLLKSTPEQATILNIIFTVVNSVSYSCFTFAFLCPILFRKSKDVNNIQVCDKGMKTLLEIKKI